MSDVIHIAPTRPSSARPKGAARPAQPPHLPLSAGQKALWFLHRSAPESAAYHVAFTARLTSALDVGALERATAALIARHDQLRAVFTLVDGEPVQHVRDDVEPVFSRVDARGLDDARLHERVVRAHATPFDLAQGSLVRVVLFTRAEADHVLLLTVHHIVYDGWSLWLNLDELRQLYIAETGGGAASMPPLRATYAEHVARERERLAGPEGDALWRFWRDRLAGEAPLLDLPGDRPRPANQSLVGASVKLELDRGLTTALKTLAKRCGVTPVTLLLAAYQVLLARYANQDVVHVGTPMSGRDDPAMAGVVGYFVNPVVIRGELAEDPPFDEFLAATHRRLVEARAHQGLPFPVLVERLQRRRDPSFSPLFQASFVWQQAQRDGSALALAAAGGARWGALQLAPYEMAQQEGQFDLELELMETGPAITGWLKYDRQIYDAGTIDRLGASFVELLRSIVVAPTTSVHRIGILTRAERAWLEARNPEPPEAARAHGCVHDRFAEVVRQRPDAIALEDGDAHLTYCELNARANRLAHHLRGRGVGPGVLVGLCLERSFDLVVGVLGILKAGGAYLPLDPRSPRDRIALIIEDSAVDLVVTEAERAPLLAESDATLVRLDADRDVLARERADDPVSGATLADVIYVIYTSGTTGRPKGVKLTHGNVARLFTATEPFYGFGADDVWTLFHSIAFDVSVWELWGAFLHGGRLVVVPYEVSRSPAAFLALLDRHRVTVLNQSPSAFRLLVPAEQQHPLPRPTSLRWIIFAGEPLDLQSLKPWVERHGDTRPTLVNMYGITETTVHSTFKIVRRADLDRVRSTIGMPIPDLKLHLLDRHGAPVPPGVPGEIWVGGRGVALGYHARPELTAARFSHRGDPTDPDGCVYRSGDLARYLPDGDIEYLGRIDNQVKLRGFRIELGEIEATLAQHPAIADAVVVARDLQTDQARLVAFVVPRDGAAVGADALRAYLVDRLPEYMVPQRFMTLETLPLTGNGKLDRRALPTDADLDETEREVVAPRDVVEQQLVAIWERLLRRRPIGVTDDFFVLGGHSLMAVQLMVEIDRAFGRELPLPMLFRKPTIASLAAAIREGGTAAPFSPLVPVQVAGERPPFFCVAGGGGNVLYYHHLAHALPAERPFYGLQLPGTDGIGAPAASVPDIARQAVAAIRHVQPAGPYLLGGHCFGALVAFEMAQQLLAAGEPIGGVAVIDAPAPRRAWVELNGVAGTATANVDEAMLLARIASVLAASAGAELELPPAILAPLDEEARLRVVQERLAATGLVPEGGSSMAIRGFLRVFIANSRIRYVPEAPRPVPIHVFRAGTFHSDYDYRAAEDPDVAPANSSLGWRDLASEIVVHEVPGDHLTMLNPPHVAALARELAATFAPF